MNNYLKLGEWNAVCGVCGFKFKASQLRERWDGLRVCEHDFETRHPLDFIKAPRETVSVPWTSQEPTDSFISDSSVLLSEDGEELTAETGSVLQTET
jgi:hypothetical protein